MELGPIFRALMHSKARFWLITLEVALTLAITVNCVNVMLDLRAELAEPSGMDEEHLIVVYTEPFAPQFKQEGFVDATREEDLARLRAFPGVRDAVAMHQIPLSTAGSATGRKPLGSELEPTNAPYFVVSDGAVSTLGVELAAGRDFEAGDFDLEEDENGDVLHRNILVTQELADALFPQGEALGQVIQSNAGESTNTIVGILRTMHNSWPQGDVKGRVMLLPGEPGNDRQMRYLVRAEPGAVESVFAGLEPLLLEGSSGRIVTLRTLSEVKRESFAPSIALMKMLSTVIVLLLLVTSLGIVGLTSFSVTQRTRQIGTRRALGATKGAIVRYFLVENWLITGIGLILGVLLTFGLNVLLVHAAGAPKLDGALVAGGMLLLWGTGLLAALAPALEATAVAPEVATRTV